MSKSDSHKQKPNASTYTSMSLQLPLPREILAHIFSFLPAKQIISLRVLSKEWDEQIKANSSIWKELCTKKYPNVYNLPKEEVSDWKKILFDFRFKRSLFCKNLKNRMLLFSTSSLGVFNVISAEQICVLMDPEDSLGKLKEEVLSAWLGKLTDRKCLFSLIKEKILTYNTAYQLSYSNNSHLDQRMQTITNHSDLRWTYLSRQ